MSYVNVLVKVTLIYSISCVVYCPIMPFYRCIAQINATNRGAVSEDELKERQVQEDAELRPTCLRIYYLLILFMYQAKALQDPEIQSILSDPVMRQVK